MSNKRFQGFLRMGQGGADAPNRHPLTALPCAVSDPRHRQLHLHSALGPQQFVPFVHHHHACRSKPFGTSFLCTQDVQRLWGCDQHISAFFCLAFSLAEVSPVLTPTSQSNPIPFTMARAASARPRTTPSCATQTSLTPLRCGPCVTACANTCPMAA